MTFRPSNGGVTTTDGVIRASDQGFIAWAGDPAWATAANQTAVTSGVGYVTRLRVDSNSAIAKCMFYTNVAMTSGTSAGLGVYDGTGAQIGTVDLSTTITSGGVKDSTLTITGTAARTAGEFLYVLLYAAFTGTAPSFRGIGTGNIPNMNANAASARYGTYGTGLSAVPASITPSSIAAASVGAQCHWFGLH